MNRSAAPMWDATWLDPEGPYPWSVSSTSPNDPRALDAVYGPKEIAALLRLELRDWILVGLRSGSVRTLRPGTHFAFSDDGGRLAVAYGHFDGEGGEFTMPRGHVGCRVVLHDVEGAAAERVIELHDAVPHRVRFVDDRVLVETRDPTGWRAYDGSGRSVSVKGITTDDFPPVPSFSRFEPRGGLTLEGDGIETPLVATLRGEAAAPLARLVTPSEIFARGDLVAISSWHGPPYQRWTDCVDLASGARRVFPGVALGILFDGHVLVNHDQRVRVEGREDEIEAIATSSPRLSGDGEVLVWVRDGQLFRRRMRDGATDAISGPEGHVRAVSRTGRTVVVVGDQGTFMVVDDAIERLSPKPTLHACASDAWVGFRRSTVGRSVRERRDDAVIVRPGGDAAPVVVPLPPYTHSFASDPEGERLFVPAKRGGLDLFDPATGTRLAGVPGDRFPAFLPTSAERLLVAVDGAALLELRLRQESSAP